MARVSPLDLFSKPYLIFKKCFPPTSCFISANSDDIPYDIRPYSDTSAYSKQKFQANRL